MKRLFVILAVTIITGTFAAANADVKYGVRAEYNLSSYKVGKIRIPKSEGSKAAEFDNKIGLRAGLTAEIPLTKKMNLVSELNLNYLKTPALKYKTSGYSNDKVLYHEHSERSISEMAVSVPVMIQRSFYESEPVYQKTFAYKHVYYWIVGIQADIPFNTKFKQKDSRYYIDDSSPVIVDETASLKDERSMVDFGIVIGLGTKMLDNFRLDIRAVPILTKPYGHTDDWLFYTSIGLGYFF